MTISLTPSAADRVRRHLASRGHGVGLRVGVRKSGCSGWSYTVDYADTVGSEDEVFENHGIRVVIDRSNLQALAGARIDYVRQGLNERFVFENPNAGEACGCGESFTIR